MFHVLRPPRRHCGGLIERRQLAPRATMGDPPVDCPRGLLVERGVVFPPATITGCSSSRRRGFEFDRENFRGQISRKLHPADINMGCFLWRHTLEGVSNFNAGRDTKF